MISDATNDKRPITAYMALQLGLFFSMESRFWLNLQTEYDLRVTWRDEEERIASRVRVFKRHAAA